jgi:hypothetical protein
MSVPVESQEVLSTGDSSSSSCSQPCQSQLDLDKAALLGEFEALRLLLGAMRGQTVPEGTVAPQPAGGVISTISCRPGSPFHDPIEAAMSVLRQLEPCAVKAAATAVAELQVK